MEDSALCRFWCCGEGAGSTGAAGGVLPKWPSARARAPGREGRQGLLQAGALLPSQQVAGRDHLAVGAGAEPPLDEQVQGGEVRHHPQAKLGNKKMDAVTSGAAARL